MHQETLEDIAAYYGAKIDANGAGPEGVDWNGKASQWLRFEKLASLITVSSDFSVNDYGCGYGALLDFLNERYSKVDYLGLDVAPAMIAAAKARFGTPKDTRFKVGAKSDRVADYAFASGIFNIRLTRAPESWLDHIKEVLDEMHQQSRRGFAFNCLSHYSDPEKHRPHLYYGDPLLLFDHCKRRYSDEVSLLHDYGLYDFTLVVRKDV